ncbi:hypothetical protein hrd7_03500 [Leptolinea sp. HRD-7]|nr:hypothetical protein hrd7_03500 [Leptolinea sp. HRD-7]
MKNSQTFTCETGHYALYRPGYPDELFAFLSGLCHNRNKAWDCATGNGQAAIAIAEYFNQVEATDISPEQLQNCYPHPRVHYSPTPAEKTDFSDSSFDLITVAQAVHWFDLPRFFAEAGRVLKPGGILALFGYKFPEVDPQIDAVIKSDLLDRIDPYWASGNRMLMNDYAEIRLPFSEVPVSQFFVIKVKWDLYHLTGYFNTWSAVKRYTDDHGTGLMDTLFSALKPVWSNPHEPREIFMPVVLKVGRKP